MVFRYHPQGASVVHVSDNRPYSLLSRVLWDVCACFVGAEDALPADEAFAAETETFGGAEGRGVVVVGLPDYAAETEAA